MNIYIAGKSNTDVWRWVIQPLLSGFFIRGIINIFLTLKVIKKLLHFDRWTTFAVVLLTLFFPVEMLLGMLLLIPNAIVFAIKSKSNG